MSDTPTPELELRPTNFQEQIDAIRTDLRVLDDTVGVLIDEVRSDIDAIDFRKVALQGAVALHAAIDYRSHSTDIDGSVIRTADTLLKWLREAK